MPCSMLFVLPMEINDGTSSRRYGVYRFSRDAPQFEKPVLHDVKYEAANTKNGNEGFVSCLRIMEVLYPSSLQVDVVPSADLTKDMPSRVRVELDMRDCLPRL